MTLPGFLSSEQYSLSYFRSPETGEFIPERDASLAGVFVLFADISEGFTHRARQDCHLASLFSIPDAVLAVAGLEHEREPDRQLAEIRREFLDFTEDLGFGSNAAVSLTGLKDIACLNQQTAPSQPAKNSDLSSDQFAVHLVWTGHDPLLPGRPYEFIGAGGATTGSVSALKHHLDLETMEQLAATILERGDIAYCNIELDDPVDFTPFGENRDLGGFRLKDKISGKNVAFGLIKFALRRATNIKWQALEIGKQERAAAKNQTPHALWFTGLSGSGKSCIASLLEKKLHAMGRHTYVLDGDNVRHGLCRDLGFTDADRVENLRRIAETARLFVDAGLIVPVSFISPFRSERRMAREMFAEGEFLEVYVNTPLEVCETRDPKGLYKKARAGKIKNFTGLDSPYEPPENADIVLPGAEKSPEELVEFLMENLKQRDLI